MKSGKGLEAVSKMVSMQNAFVNVMLS